MFRCTGLLILVLSVGCRTDGTDPNGTDPDGTGVEGGAPTAQDVAATVEEDTQTNIRLEATSPDGEDLTFDIASQPSFGTLILDGRRVEYTPNTDYNGPDSFTFTASDPDGPSAPATVSIDVTAVNDAPTASVGDMWRMVGQNVVLTAETADAEDDPVTLTWRQTSGPTVDLTGPAPAFTVESAGIYRLELDVADGTATTTVPIAVRVIDLDMSEGHVVAVDADGVAWAWGANDTGEVGPVPGEHRLPVPVCTVGDSFPCSLAHLNDVAAVAAGDDYSLALLNNGTVVGWGANTNSGLGDDYATPAAIGTLSDITAIATSGTHNLALDADGTVWSWGGNRSGQLGHGTEGNDVDPEDAAQVCVAFDFDAGDAECTQLLTDVVEIAVSKDDELHSMALDSAGTVWAWGASRNGIFADGCVERDDCDRRRIAMPVCTPESAATDTCVALTGAAAIAMGGEHAIARMTDGTALTWGDDNDGVLAQGCDLDSGLCDEVSVPRAVCAPGESAPCTPMADIAEVSSGAEHTLLLTESGALFSVGGNSEGELGNGCEGELNCRVSVSTVQPVCAVGETFPCAPMTNVAAIRAGFENSFALTNTGELLAWGYNSTSMLGDGSDGILFARQVNPDTDWETVRAGAYASVATKTDGSLWAWGDDRTPIGNCDLGVDGSDPDGCSVSPYQPVQLTDPDGTTLSTDWADVFAGRTHLGAIKTDGTAYLWGEGSAGELGFDAPDVVGLPVELAEAPWTSLDGGDEYTVGLAADGSLWTWGSNGQGQLGDGTEDERFTPEQVVRAGETAADTDWTSMSAGEDFVLAIKSDGTLWAWGDGGRGQLASDVDDDSGEPIQVLGPEGSPSPTDWDVVSAGSNHAVGIRSGVLWAWGDGSGGALGNGCGATDTCDLFDETTTPIPVAGPDGLTPLTDWMLVDAGEDHSIAVRSNGTVYAFGQNDQGSLGTGLGTDADRPTAVCADWNALTWTCAEPLGGVVQISAADETGFAIRDDGTLWAWGDNDGGRLGYGRPDAGYPVPVLWLPAGR